MASISLPFVTENIQAAPTLVEDAPQRILMLGQKTGGTAITDTLITQIGINDGDALFGERSMLATMVREFRAINTVSQLDAIPFDDDGGGEQAKATITFAGTSTEAGDLSVTIQSDDTPDFKFVISIPEGQSADDTSDALADAITENDTILVQANTAVFNPPIVSASCVHFGSVGNNITWRVDTIPAGLSAVMTPFSGGTGVVATDLIADLIADIRYQTIIYPGNYDLGDLVTILNDRFNVDNQVLDGIGVVAATDTVDEFIKSVPNLGTFALVTQNVLVLANRLQDTSDTYNGGGLFQFDPVTSSRVAAVRTLRLTDGQDITGFLAGSSVTNFTGGADRAAFPYHNTPFTMFAAIEDQRGWSTTDQASLNTAGISFLGNDPTNTFVIAGDFVTTYQTVVLGGDNNTFQFLNAVDTASAVREFFFNNNKERFAQTVLTAGAVVPNLSQANITSVESFQTQLYAQLAGQDFGLVTSGNQAITDFKNSLVVAIEDLQAGSVSITFTVLLVSQLRKITSTILVSFNNTST